MPDRWYAPVLGQTLRRPFVHLLFGARQTGKSTLLDALLPADAVWVDLADPAVRARHAAASLAPTLDTVRGNPGPRFEQWVGIELWKRLQYLGDGQLSYFRTHEGAEVDFVIERGGKLIPIEVKWTERPGATDARHLRRFIREHTRRVATGYIICRCPAPQQIEEKILALPWSYL